VDVVNLGSSVSREYSLPAYWRRLMTCCSAWLRNAKCDEDLRRMVLALIVPLQEQAERPQLCIEAKHRYHIPQQPWGESSRRIGLSHTDLGIQDLSFLAPSWLPVKHQPSHQTPTNMEEV